jgi:hypothetical protein
MLANSRQTLWSRTEVTRTSGGCHLPIKDVLIPLETEYLQEAARMRGISKTKLVRLVMEKVVSEKLVLDILDDDNQVRLEPPQPQYRRFRKEVRD